MIRGAIERLHRVPGRFVRGTPIWDLEWDICCILDGCRVDTFREFVPDADSYRSVGTTSPEWLERTFGADRDLSRVAYVSANPFATNLDPDRFGYYHLEPVRETDHGIETVEPAALRDRGATVWQRRGELGIDRLVVHFMQPHVPFRSRPVWFTRFSGSEVWGSRAWNRVADGSIDRDEWFRAYADNLQWVLAEGVDPLLDRVDATIGLTSDHGNAAGEWSVAGHPRGVAVPAVRRVPWWTIEATRRCESDETVDLDVSPGIDREDQLRALGYR